MKISGEMTAGISYLETPIVFDFYRVHRVSQNSIYNHDSRPIGFESSVRNPTGNGKKRALHL